MKPDLITITTPETSITYALLEPETLAEMREIVRELAASDVHGTGYDGDLCIFCDAEEPKHKAGCLIARAQEAIQ